MSNPFDPESHRQVHGLLQHIPLLGMIAAARGGARVEFWHLIIAIIGLGVLLGSTFGTIIWNESRTVTELAEQIKQVRRDNEVQDATTAYIKRRQELNEDVIHQLQTDSALLKEADARMLREHADIYSAIRTRR